MPIERLPSPELLYWCKSSEVPIVRCDCNEDICKVREWIEGHLESDEKAYFTIIEADLFGTTLSLVNGRQVKCIELALPNKEIFAAFKLTFPEFFK